MSRSLWLLLALVLTLPAPAAAQQSMVGQQPVMLVVDISGSMDDEDGAGVRKIDGAKLALLDYVGSVEPSVLIGLRTYPDQSGGSCNSGQRVIDLGPADPKAMSARIRSLSPDGDTPTAEAMRAAVKDLRAANATSGTLVIVSDGESTCDDPCEAAEEIAGQGFDLDAITVGFKISDAGRKQLECISNALDGRYLDIGESDELRDTLDRLGRPRIEVKIDGAVNREVIAGGDAVDITARITNTGQIEARDAIGQLTIAAEGVDVLRPISRLGNLAPAAARTVTWTVRAGPQTAGRSLAYSVVGRAVNASATGEAKGTLTSIGVTAANVGKILAGPGKGIAILGDSYSAGEGADAYDAGTDNKNNTCHRSPLTYLVPAFDPKPHVIACSGALTSEVLTPNDANKDAKGHHEPAQIDALEAYQTQRKAAVRAVVMTLGGNDAGFPAIGKSCVMGRKSCTDTIFTDLPWNQTTSESKDDFIDRHIGPPSPLLSALESTYESVNRSLNSDKIVGLRDGKTAPILVLGYPLPVPLQGRTCGPMGSYTIVLSTLAGSIVKTVYLLSDAEIDFIVDYALRLNGIVESAVENARRDSGVPVFYVPTTEFAFQPNHTVCDSKDPYARATTSFNGGGFSAGDIIALANPRFDLGSTINRFLTGADVAKRGMQELAHPNAKGYAAETQAILRWTRSRAADAAVAFTTTAKPAEPAETSWNVSTHTLGPPGLGAGLLQGGTTYPLKVGGFAPNSAVHVEAHSAPRLLGVIRADARGVVSGRVGIPRDLEDGDHELQIVGRDARNHARIARIPFSFDGPFRPGVLQSMGVGSAIAVLLGLVLLTATGELRRWRRWCKRVMTTPSA